MIEFKNVSFEAENGHKIIKNLSIAIPDGRQVAVTGPNGGGKTTFAKLIAGIVKPTSGQILFNGYDITDVDITERAKMGICYAFQQPVRFKGITVRQLMQLADKNADENRICTTLRQVGVDPSKYLDRNVDGSLSGGEIKRIEIATVLLRKAAIRVFDEPEAGIDLWSFNSLSGVFASLRGENETTVIISHQERILAAVDDILVICAGEVMNYGEREKILSGLGCDFGHCKGCGSKVNGNE